MDDKTIELQSVNSNNDTNITIDSNISPPDNKNMEYNVINEQKDILDGNYYLNKRPWKVGNVITLFWYKDFPIITIGPHWPFFLCLNSIIMIIAGSYFYFLWNIFYPIGRNIGLTIFAFQSFCYFFTAFFNPGIPFNKYRKEFNFETENKDNIRFCNDCHVIMDLDLDTSHCPECDICCEGLDHHCPWTGKCIGKNTLWTFYGFVFGTLFLLVYLLFGLVFIKPMH
jgi:hypothetical protein